MLSHAVEMESGESKDPSPSKSPGHTGIRFSERQPARLRTLDALELQEFETLRTSFTMDSSSFSEDERLLIAAVYSSVGGALGHLNL